MRLRSLPDACRRGGGRSNNAVIRCQRTLSTSALEMASPKPSPAPLGSATTATPFLPSQMACPALLLEKPFHLILLSCLRREAESSSSSLLHSPGTPHRGGICAAPPLSRGELAVCEKPGYLHDPGRWVWRTTACQAGEQLGRSPHTPCQGRPAVPCSFSSSTHHGHLLHQSQSCLKPGQQHLLLGTSSSPLHAHHRFSPPVLQRLGPQGHFHPQGTFKGAQGLCHMVPYLHDM